MPKKNSGPESHPQAVLQQIELLARNITVARKRRGETQAQWAKRLGVSQPTMARIERGDPAVAMASYVMCMWLVNPAVDLAGLIAPVNDHAALEREVLKVEQGRRSQTPTRPGKASPTRPQAVKSGESGQIRGTHGPKRAAVDVPLALDKPTGPSGAGLSVDRELEMAEIQKSLERASVLNALKPSVASEMEKIRKAAVGDLGKPTPTAKGLASLLSKGSQ